MNIDFEKYLEIYSEKLLKESKEKLWKSYNYESILKNDFDIVNSNLIDKALHQNEYNLFIQTILTERKINYYLPVVISVAASLLKKNNNEDRIYSKGDILQKDGKRYEVIGKDNNRYALFYFPKGGGKGICYKNIEELNTYIITTANLSNRRVVTKFYDYKDLFHSLLNIEFFPSKFPHKSVIILEKKSFLDELKYQSAFEFDFRKSIPFQWVSKNGIQKNESEYIPIEPMIYLIPEYEVFQEHIADKIENLDSVIFIGKNKYEPYMTKIKRDLRRKIIPKAIFIGSNDINDIINLKKWKWTYPEVQILNKINKNKSTIIEVTSDKFLQNIEDFKDYIKDIENEYSIDLKSIIYFTRFLYSLVVIGFYSRLDNQLEFVDRVLKEKTETIISENLYSINQNPKNIIDYAKEKINNMFEHLTCDKFINFIIQEKINIIVVPNRQKNAWDEIVKLFTHLSEKRTKVFSINKFMKMQSLFNTPQNVYIFSLFGFRCMFNDLIKLLSKSSHKIYYILYTDEKKLLENEIKNIEDEQISEYCSDDRKQLCGVDYPIKRESESIHQKIEKLYSDYSGFNQKYHYDLSEHLYYQITFENSEIEEIDGNRTIILEKDQEYPRKEQVSNLMIGDEIRIYENTDRKKLFILAKQEDDEGRLDTILSYSKSWKESLLRFFNNIDSILYNEESLLNELKTNGATITLPTLRNWLNPDNDNLFPNEIENLKAIQKTIKDDEFDSAFKDILKSRKLYRSIMISLGHNLSDELNDYIISKKKNKGEFLQKFSDNQIDSFLNHTAPLRTIKNIEIVERGFDE